MIASLVVFGAESRALRTQGRLTILWGQLPKLLPLPNNMSFLTFIWGGEADFLSGGENQLHTAIWLIQGDQRL